MAANDGRRMAAGRVYRSDALVALTAEERVALRERCGVRTVIDLRSSLEQQRFGRYDAALLGVEVVELPVFDGAAVREQASKVSADMAAMNHAIFFDGAPRIGEALRRLADPDGLAAVVTCSGGKDRTGATIAVLQAALGVPLEQVLDDYERSGPAMAALRARILGGFAGEAIEVPPHAFVVDRDAFGTVLAEIAARPGGFAGYIDAAAGRPGLTDELAATLLEPVPSH